MAARQERVDLGYIGQALENFHRPGPSLPRPGLPGPLGILMASIAHFKDSTRLSRFLLIISGPVHFFPFLFTLLFIQELCPFCIFVLFSFWPSGISAYTA